MEFEEAGGFKRSIQSGYVKGDPEPEAFSMLPRELVERVGVQTHKGARVDLAILSHMFHQYARSLDVSGPIQFEQGFTEELERGEFILSMQTTAEDIAARWLYSLTRSDIENPDGSRTKQFDSFYRTVVRGFKRLESLAYIERRRYVNGKHNGIYGTVWTLSPDLCQVAQRAPRCPSAPPVLIHADVPDGEWVSAVDKVGKQFLSETSALYTMGEACTSLRDRGRYLQHENWCDVVADNQPDAPRHVSIGAFKQTRWIDENTPCTVPWVVLEAEAGDIVERYGATCRMLETLDAEGVDLSRVVVTYSGNQSFHIRIPQGMFGNPVFSSVEQCRRVLSRWAYDHFDEHLDVNLFDPRHLIRCTGSKHEKGGRVTPFSGDEFMGGLEYVLTSTSTFNPHSASPRLVPVDPWLMTSLADAADSLSRFWIMAYEDAPTMAESGAFTAAMKGCGEGEQWHEKHVGRSKLCFVAGCYLIRKYGEELAWPELEEVNELNSPPLPQNELRACFKSALRTVRRANLHSGAKSNL